MELDGPNEWSNGMVNNDVGIALRKDRVAAGLEYYPVMPEM